MRHLLIALAMACFAAGCTTLNDNAKKIRVIGQGAQGACKFIQLVTVRVSLGPDKPGQALKKALNETAALGGNAFMLVTSNQDVFDGAAVAGEALSCP